MGRKQNNTEMYDYMTLPMTVRDKLRLQELTAGESEYFGQFFAKALNAYFEALDKNEVTFTKEENTKKRGPVISFALPVEYDQKLRRASAYYKKYNKEVVEEAVIKYLDDLGDIPDPVITEPSALDAPAMVRFVTKKGERAVLRRKIAKYIGVESLAKGDFSAFFKAAVKYYAKTLGKEW